MAFKIGDKVRPKYCSLNKDKIGEVVEIRNLYNYVKFSEDPYEYYDYLDKELIKLGTDLLNWLRKHKKNLI